MYRIAPTLALCTWLALPTTTGAQQRAGSIPAATDTVTVKVFQFSPDTVRARVGVIVHWINGDEIAHTVTSGVDARADGRFRVVLPVAGATAFITPREPGSFRYFCERHPNMTGTVTVTH